MRKKIVAFHGNYFDNNFGDLLLFKVFEKWVSALKDCDIIFPLVPEHEQPRFLTHFPNARFSGKWDSLIYTGGGLFSDTGFGSRFLPGFFDKRFFKENVRPAEICIKNKIPYAVIGLEVGPLSNIFTRHLTKRIFNNANIIAVRDVESVEFLRNELKVYANVDLATDPAVTVSKEDIPERANEKIAKLLAPFAKSILFGIHHPRDFLGETPASQSIQNALIGVLRSAPEILPVLFTDIGDDKYSSHCDRLGSIIKEATGRECLLVPFPGVWETVALISNLSAVLTTKLHVGIVSYAMGVYCESFANHPKTKRFYKILDREDQCALFIETTEEIADMKIKRAIKKATSKVDIVNEKWREVKNLASRNRNILANFLT